MAASSFIGLLVGISAAGLEAVIFPRLARRLPLGAVLALQTVAYTLVVVTATAAVAGLVWIGEDTLSFTDLPGFNALLGTWAVEVFLSLLILSSFLINLGTQLRLVLGPEMLVSLLVGRYRRPVVEERVFLFLDLADSTAIAEELGPLRFTALKNDFFGDIAGPVLDTGGHIVQYVGDQVMLTWRMKRALWDAAPIRFFFLVERAISGHADWYSARYGTVPHFRAGLHGGEVVTAQVGTLRLDIVHSGDVVNTAARIQAECRLRKRRLLTSSDLLNRMHLPEGLQAEDLGEAPLRGKEDSVHLFSIEGLPSYGVGSLG
jgi:adenylate cyclase